MKTVFQRKLDPELQYALEQHQSGQARVLLTTEHPLGHEEQLQLEREGYQVTSTFGTVVSGTVPLERVPGVASLDFVDYVELARRLHRE
jgi:hypothetical protein